MYKSKLIGILKTLNSQEREGLRKWIYSPSHNHREDRKKLFDYLLSKRKLSSFNTNRKKIFQHIFPDIAYCDRRMRKLMNIALQSLESFVHFSLNKNNVFQCQKSMIVYLNNLNLDKYSHQYIEKAQKKLSKQLTQNSTYFDEKFQLEQLIFEKDNSSGNRETTNLQNIFDAQYHRFVLDTLYYSCEARTHQRLYRSEYEIPFLESILTDIQNGKFEEIPAIQMYYRSYMALVAPEDEHHFKILQSLLVLHGNRLLAKELQNIYYMGINYCVRQLNTGKENYVRSVFELYQYGLENKILFENNILSRFSYKNIVAVGLRLKEFDWVLQFIDNYTTSLESIYQKSYSQYANAKRFFMLEDYDKTLELLAQVDFDNIFLNMDAKSMLLKIYYEKKYFDALDSLLSSFKRFLQRKSILTNQKQIHQNMILFTKRLLDLSVNDNKKAKEKLRQEIIECTPLTEKPWLLAQLAKYEKI